MPEVQTIFQQYGQDYHKEHPIQPIQDKALRNIGDCRTARIGGHADQCDACGHLEISYNSCRNRHCPKCQTLLKEKWIDARKEDLLPVPYYHVVFSIPEELNQIVYQNQEEVYKLFFAAVASTLKELSVDKKYLGAQIGFTSIIHTWGQNLMYHPHIHVIVPAGGLTPSGHFISGKKKFFIPVKVLSRKFRGKFLAMLITHYETSQLNFYSSISEYADGQHFKTLLRCLYQKEWVVYCKKTFNGPGAVLEYLGRYTHRVCISNDRILKVADNLVTLKWKDYRDNKIKIMTITAHEFIRRFLLHVLPSGFQKIRHYGLLSNRNRSSKLRRCQKLAGNIATKAQFKDLCTHQIIKIITGKDITLCRRCHTGKLWTVRLFVGEGTSPPLHK